MKKRKQVKNDFNVMTAPSIKKIEKDGLPFETAAESPAYKAAHKRLLELKADANKLDSQISWETGLPQIAREYDTDRDIAAAVASGDLDIENVSDLNKKEMRQWQKLAVLRKAIEVQQDKVNEELLKASIELAPHFEKDMEAAFIEMIDFAEGFSIALDNLFKTMRHLRRVRGILPGAIPARWHVGGLFAELTPNQSGGGKFQTMIAQLKQNWYGENSPILPYKVDKPIDN